MRHSLALAFLAFAAPVFAAPVLAAPVLAAPVLAAPVLAQTSPPQVAPPSPPMTAYGTEQYKPDRKVVWAFTKDECREGYWYDQGPQICFVYEDPNNPQCWLFFMGSAGMKAAFIGDGAGSDLSEVAQSAGPMGCMGPQVGV